MERKDEHGKHYSTGKEDRCSCGKILRHKSKIAAGVFFLAGVFSCWTVMAFKTQQSCPPPRPDSCADGWIGYKGKCYYFTEAEGNWTYSRSRCSALGASLAGIDTKQDLNQTSSCTSLAMHTAPDQCSPLAQSLTAVAHNSSLLASLSTPGFHAAVQRHHRPVDRTPEGH
ncbi:C-type lectin domain family 2 member D5-like isoform X3 [Pelodiscus sinensis]|uniref:C-type lectin domain family 2 member D5-like isoform X3 n=1 Tax=Pelodiscus sinensis TaxID=13735 RepID=UPI003F6AED17